MCVCVCVWRGGGGGSCEGIEEAGVIYETVCTVSSQAWCVVCASGVPLIMTIAVACVPQCLFIIQINALSHFNRTAIACTRSTGDQVRTARPTQPRHPTDKTTVYQRRTGEKRTTKS